MAYIAPKLKGASPRVEVNKCHAKLHPTTFTEKWTQVYLGSSQVNTVILLQQCCLKVTTELNGSEQK